MVKIMSDPVTKVEIEDVLSSIRRLVSSDERPKPAEPGAVASPVEKDRLVLTPALRIDDAAQDPRLHVPGQDDHMDEVDAATQPSGDEDADVQSAASVDEPDTSFTSGRSRDAKAELKARVAELEEVVSRQGDQWEPDGTTTSANSGSPVASLPWEDYVTDAQEEAHQDAAEAAPNPTPEFHHSKPTEQAVNAQAGADSSADLSAGAENSNPDEAQGDSARDFPATKDEFLDEEALRDLVADIVRQELQGALGERITRNVRKLVRREIHRALASQELQ